MTCRKSWRKKRGEKKKEEEEGKLLFLLSLLPVCVYAVCILLGGLLFRGGPLWSPLLSLPHGRLRLQNHVAGTLCTAAAAAAAAAASRSDRLSASRRLKFLCWGSGGLETFFVAWALCRVEQKLHGSAEFC